MPNLTGRLTSSLAVAAILLFAACAERSHLLGSGGASGAPAATGGAGGVPAATGGVGGAPAATGGAGGVPAATGGASGAPAATGGAGGGPAATGGASGAPALMGGAGGYWHGDGIAPRGGGGTSGGSGGAGGVDPNCFMRCGQGNAIYYPSGGAGGSPDARPAEPDSSNTDCETMRQLYYAAVSAAGQCDPTASVPCAAYDGVECPTVGVSPGSVASLNAKLAEYKSAGCSLPRHSCPISVVTPAPYTCQPDTSGGHRCYSVCESMVGGKATCVSTSSGCKTAELSAGFCSGTAMVCCSP